MRNRTILIASTLAALALVGCEQPETIERAERYAGQEEEVVVTEGEQPMGAEEGMAQTGMTAGEVKFTQTTGPVMWRAQELGGGLTQDTPEIGDVLENTNDMVTDVDVNQAMEELQEQEGQPEPTSWHEVKGQLTLELVNVREMQDQQMGQQRMQGQQVGQQPAGEGMDQEEMQDQQEMQGQQPAGEEMDQEQMARDQQPMGKEELAQQPDQEQPMGQDQEMAQGQEQREQQMQERQEMAQQMQTQDRIQLTAVMTDNQGNEVRIEPQRPVVPPKTELSGLDGAFEEFGQGDQAAYSGWFLGNVVVNGQTTDQQRLMYVSARPLQGQGLGQEDQGLGQEMGQEARELGQDAEQLGQEGQEEVGMEPEAGAERTAQTDDQEQQQYAVHVLVLPVEMSGNTPEMSELQSLDELAMTGTTEAGQAEGEGLQQGTEMGGQQQLDGVLHIVYAGAQKVEEPTAAKPAG